MLFTAARQNVRSAGGDVSEHATSRTARELGEQLLRKPIGKGWKRAHEMHTRDLPVSGRAVLAGGCGLQKTVGRLGSRRRGDTLYAIDVAEPGALQRRHAQPAYRARDIAERVGT